MCENRLELFVQNVFRKQLIMASKDWDFLHERHVDDTLISFWACPQFQKKYPSLRVCRSFWHDLRHVVVAVISIDRVVYP